MEEKQRFEILLEDMNSKIGAIADGHNVLSRQIQESREEAKGDIQEVKVLLAVSVKDLHQKIDGIRQELKDDMAGVKQELKDDMARVKQELKDDMAGVRQELKGEIERVEKGLRGVERGLSQELKETREELGGKIDRVCEIVEDHSQRISRLEEKVLIS